MNPEESNTLNARNEIKKEDFSNMSSIIQLYVVKMMSA